MPRAWITNGLIYRVTYPAILDRAGVDPVLFPERARRDPGAKAEPETFLRTAPDGITLPRIRAATDENEEWPLSFDVLMEVNATTTVAEADYE